MVHVHDKNPSVAGADDDRAFVRRNENLFGMIDCDNASIRVDIESTKWRVSQRLFKTDCSHEPRLPYA